MCIPILNKFYSSITDSNYSSQFDKIIFHANLLTQAREKK